MAVEEDSAQAARDGAPGRVSGATSDAPGAPRGHAHVSSATPGRVRVKLRPQLRHVHVMHQVHAHLADRAGVDSVQTNTTTGSVVVNYNPAERTRDDILAMFRDIGIIVADIAGAGEELAELDSLATGEAGGHSRAAVSIVDAVDDLNRRVARFTGGRVDLKLLFPLTLGAVGVAKVMQNGLEFSEVPAYVLLWYAFDAFYKLHTRPGQLVSSSSAGSTSAAAGSAPAESAAVDAVATA